MLYVPPVIAPLPVLRLVPLIAPVVDIEPLAVDMLPLVLEILPLVFKLAAPVIAPPLDTLTPFIVNALPLADVKARVPVELMLGVVTLVENVGLLTVPTVKVPPRDNAPPPVILVPLLIVTELFTRAPLAMVVNCICAPSRFVRLAPLITGSKPPLVVFTN